MSLSAGVLDYNDDFYIPISEMTSLYNIEAEVKEKCAIISSLYNELTVINTTKKTSLKEKTKSLSHTIQKIEENSELIYIEEDSKSDWIKVLTHEGNIGYIKNKNLTEKEVRRLSMQDMRYVFWNSGF